MSVQIDRLEGIGVRRTDKLERAKFRRQTRRAQKPGRCRCETGSLPMIDGELGGPPRCLLRGRRCGGRK